MLGIAFGVRIRLVIRQLILESDHVIVTLVWPAFRPMLEGALDARFKLFFRFQRQYEKMVLDAVLDPAVASG